MTKREAKKLTIEVWTYFAENPGCRLKANLPQKLFYKIRYLRAWCPLCEYNSKKAKSEETACMRCCIAGKTKQGGDDCHLYWKWNDAISDKERSKAAQAIVDKVRAW